MINNCNVMNLGRLTCYFTVLQNTAYVQKIENTRCPGKEKKEKEEEKDE